MMLSARVANCVMCDDIRFEVGNKISLMGIYTGDIYFGVPFPLVVPKFAVAVWLITDVEDVVASMTVRILLPPNRAELMKTEIPIQRGSLHKEGATKSNAFATLSLPAFTLIEEGYMEVMVDTDLGTLRGGRLMIHSSAGP